MLLLNHTPTVFNRYRQKRMQRLKAYAEGQKKIRYECRKVLADARPRVKGRFVKVEGDAAGEDTFGGGGGGSGTAGGEDSGSQGRATGGGGQEAGTGSGGSGGVSTQMRRGASGEVLQEQVRRGDRWVGGRGAEVGARGHTLPGVCSSPSPSPLRFLPTPLISVPRTLPFLPRFPVLHTPPVCSSCPPLCS